jgi:hypothetical protein
MTLKSRRLLALEIAVCGAPMTIAGSFLILFACALAFDPATSKLDFWFATLALAATYALCQYWWLALCTIKGRKFTFGKFYYAAVVSAIVSSIGLVFYMPPLLFLAALLGCNALKLLKLQKLESDILD